MLKPIEKPATVAILGGNPVIGKALQSLLRSADYAARFFSEYPEGNPDPLGDARVVLILPALSSRHHEALITLIRDTPSTTDLPVIELITTPTENGKGQVTRVPWPCSIVELRRSIDEKLLEDAPDTRQSREPANTQSHDEIAS